MGSSLGHAGSFIAACGLFVVSQLLSSSGVRVFLFSGCGAQAPGCVGSVVCGTRA